MRVAVVGAEGYIGRALVAELGRRFKGEQILRFDPCIYGQVPHFSTILSGAPDIIIAELKRAQPEAVVWLGAYAHDPAGRMNPEAIMHNNARAPLAVARYCCSRNVRFIAASSLSVFAHHGAYPESKRHLERELYNLPFWQFADILRFGTVFGVVEDQDVESFRSHLLLNKMMLDAATEQRIHVTRVTVRRPVLPLGHAVRAIMDRLLSEGPYGVVENHALVSGTIHQYAEAVADIFPWRTSAICAKTVEEAESVPPAAPVIVADRDWADLRDYGWGKFVVKKLTPHLFPLLHFVEKHKGVLREVNEQAMERMYRYLKEFHG